MTYDEDGNPLKEVDAKLIWSASCITLPASVHQGVDYYSHFTSRSTSSTRWDESYARVALATWLNQNSNVLH